MPPRARTFPAKTPLYSGPPSSLPREGGDRAPHVRRQLLDLLLQLLGEARITPGTNTRGALATQLIEVANDPLEDESDTKSSIEGILRGDDAYLGAILKSAREGTPLPSPPMAVLTKSRFWVSLEQQRRPPQQGCWLIKEMLPLQLTEFQRLNEGGEEFEGEDTG